MGLQIGIGLSLSVGSPPRPELPLTTFAIDTTQLWVKGKKVDCRVADGLQTGLDLLEADMTIVGAVLCTSIAAGTEGIVHKGGNADAVAGYEVFRDGAALKAAISNGTTRVVATIGPIAAGTTYTFGVTFDRSGNMTGWLGTTAGTPADISALSAVIDSSVDFCIGSQSGTNYFGGRIGYVAIYSRVLTDAEIRRHTTQGLPVTYASLTGSLLTGLVSFWQGNQAPIDASNPVLDQTATNNDLTFTPGELVTNGTFDSDTDWTKGNGWSIASGVATRTNVGSTTFVQQAVPFVPGHVYDYSYSLSGYVSGDIGLFLGTTSVGDSGAQTPRATANGIYSGALTIQATSTDILYMRGSSSFAGSVDNITVKAKAV